MNTRARLSLELILASLALGVLGDALLRAGPWGINALIWLLALLGTALALARTNGIPLDWRAAWPAVPALLAAAGMAWRDSPVLKALDFLAICALLALVIWRARGKRVLLGGVFEQAARFLRAGLQAVGGYIPLFLDGATWVPQTTDGWARRTRAVALGVALAAPLLIVFGALLASADAVFRQLLGRFVDFDLATLASHVVPSAICAWVVAGWLIGLLWREVDLEFRWKAPLRVQLGTLEVGVVMGLLNALFLGFILVQLRYLFGGADLVEVTPGLTYAAYARQGFFELVAVAVLAVPVMLAGDWLLGSGSHRGFRIQAAFMLLALLVILASAYQRLRLYQAEYGWTEQRLYVTAFMAWLGVMLVCFAATVLAGRRQWFVSCGSISAGILVAALHLGNPDAWVVERNLARARRGHGFDATYAAQLSADAAPALAAAWGELTNEQRRSLARSLKRWLPAGTPDRRLWSWSRAEAQRHLRPLEDEVLGLAPR